MSLEEITLGLFAASNGLRIAAYVPQIRKAAIDENGVSAISYATWLLFLLAHLSTIAYALVNREDGWLAGCFAANALCCTLIVVFAFWNRCRHTRRLRQASCLATGVQVEAHSIGAGAG